MFIFKDICSDDMGVKVTALPPFSLSTENVNPIEPEGYDGSLTEVLNYKSDTKMVECDYEGDNQESVLEWLDGSGDVQFSNIPGYFYKARINNQIPISEILRNKIYEFPVSFLCQPFRYFIDGKKPIEININGITINNPGNYIAKPVMTITGSGDITININGRVFTITDLSGSITIVSEIESVLDDKGGLMDGAFPYFDRGKNTISWTGTVSNIKIIPYWRSK